MLTTPYPKIWYFYDFNDGLQRAVPFGVIIAHYIRANYNLDSLSPFATPPSSMVAEVECMFCNHQRVIDYATSLPYDTFKPFEVIVRTDLPVSDVYHWGNPAAAKGVYVPTNDEVPK